ncbi:Uncharacterized protein QTN25_005971 [Entamoeba marina]
MYFKEIKDIKTLVKVSKKCLETIQTMKSNPYSIKTQTTDDIMKIFPSLTTLYTTDYSNRLTKKNINKIQSLYCKKTINDINDTIQQKWIFSKLKQIKLNGNVLDWFCKNNSKFKTLQHLHIINPQKIDMKKLIIPTLKKVVIMTTFIQFLDIYTSFNFTKQSSTTFIFILDDALCGEFQRYDQIKELLNSPVSNIQIYFQFVHHEFINYNFLFFNNNMDVHRSVVYNDSNIQKLVSLLNSSLVQTISFKDGDLETNDCIIDLKQAHYIQNVKINGIFGKCYLPTQVQQLQLIDGKCDIEVTGNALEDVIIEKAIIKTLNLNGDVIKNLTFMHSTGSLCMKYNNVTYNNVIKKTSHLQTCRLSNILNEKKETKICFQCNDDQSIKDFEQLTYIANGTTIINGLQKSTGVISLSGFKLLHLMNCVFNELILLGSLHTLTLTKTKIRTVDVDTIDNMFFNNSQINFFKYNQIGTMKGNEQIRLIRKTKN